MPPFWWPPLYSGPLPGPGGTFPSGGATSSRGMTRLAMTPPEPSPASPVVQTLDKDDDEDIAEDQPMPAQPLLLARRPRAASIADPGDAAEAPAEGVATPVEAPAQVVPPAPVIDASSEGAVAPASTAFQEGQTV